MCKDCLKHNIYVSEHRFQSFYVGSLGFPVNAVVAGHESDGSQIFIGRAYHMGDLLPAKIVPSKKIAFVSYGGQEVPVRDVEVLCQVQYTWRPSSGGRVPPGAVNLGKSASGERVYAGRAYFQGSLTPGKVHPAHNCLYFPYAGDEISVEEYEVLCLE